MDDLGARTELPAIIGDPVIEAGAHGENDIAVVHGHIGLVEAVHPQHAQKLPIRSGIGAEPISVLVTG
jgi:hypothetical protein